MKFEIEMLIRHYGITSSNDFVLFEFDHRNGRLECRYGDHPVAGYFDNDQQFQYFCRCIGVNGPAKFEGINIQLCREVDVSPSQAQVIDFGHYTIRDRFELPVVSLVCDRQLGWGGVIHADSPHYVQPLPALRLPIGEWCGRAGLRWEKADRSDRPRDVAYQLAELYRAGALTGTEVRERLDSALRTAVSKWPPSTDRV